MNSVEQKLQLEAHQLHFGSFLPYSGPKLSTDLVVLEFYTGLHPWSLFYDSIFFSKSSQLFERNTRELKIHHWANRIPTPPKWPIFDRPTIYSRGDCLNFVSHLHRFVSEFEPTLIKMNENDYGKLDLESKIFLIHLLTKGFRLEWFNGDSNFYYIQIREHFSKSKNSDRQEYCKCLVFKF